MDLDRRHVVCALLSVGIAAASSRGIFNLVADSVEDTQENYDVDFSTATQIRNDKKTITTIVTTFLTAGYNLCLLQNNVIGRVFFSEENADDSNVVEEEKIPNEPRF